MAKKSKQIVFIAVALLIGSFLLFFMITRQKKPANKKQTAVQSSFKFTDDLKEKESNPTPKINPQSLEDEKYSSEEDNPRLKEILDQLTDTCEENINIFSNTILETLKTIDLDAQDIPTLSRLLNSGTTDCQNRIALAALSKIKEENIIIPLSQLEKILDQLADNCEKQIRPFFQATLEVLNWSAQDIPILSKLLDSGTTECQNYIALDALNKINDENIIAPLIRFIENPLINPESKCDAVWALAKFNNDQAADVIAKRMNDIKEDEQLRTVSALSLGEMLKTGNEKALDYLIKGINTDDVGIEYKCIQALENAQSDVQQNKAIPALLEKLNTTQNKDIKDITLRTLGYFHDERVINTLINVVENSDDAFLRTLAVWSLERIGDPAAIDCIKKASQDDNEFLSNAARKALDSMLKK